MGTFLCRRVKFQKCGLRPFECPLFNFYYSIFQFGEKRITLRIFASKNTKLYKNDMELQHSS